MPRTAIVVPGHGAFGATGYRITERCRRLVAAAEALSARRAPSAVVFTGWSPDGGPSEAEQMRGAWRGPAVELVVEPTASVTAENAARTVPLLLTREVELADIVCAPFHYLRARYFFHRLYGAHGIRARLRVVPERPSSRALAWELAALPVARRQLHRALAELDRSAR
jgi:uncharacterized SAM-binding protein YcdF (DUF218 family)